MFDLENDCQGHGVQYSHWRHSMANINVCKTHWTHFRVSIHRFQDINIQDFDLENLFGLQRTT